VTQLFKRFLLFLLLVQGPGVFALAKIGFIDIFPTFRIGTPNFFHQELNRLTYIDYHNQNKPIVLGFDFSYKNFDFYLALDFMQHVMVYNENYPYSNVPMGSSGFVNGLNTNVPTAGYIAFDNDFIEFSVGRRRWALGPGDYSLSVGRDTPYFDGLWFGIHPKITEDITFSYYFLGAADDQAAIELLYDWNEKAYNDDPASAPEFVYLQQLSEKTRWFFAHKIGISTPTFRIGLTESMVIDGKPITAWLSNPFMIWHNTYMPDGGNVAMTLDVEKLIGSHVRVYGQFTLDDWQLGWEGYASAPNALGIYAGVDWQVFDSEEIFSGPRADPYAKVMADKSFRFKRGLILSLQAAYASRYLYNRHSKEPLGKFAFFNTLQSGGGGDFFLMENYLGFAYGPDTALAEVSAQWQSERWYVDGRIGLLFQGADSAANGGYYTSDYYHPQGIFERGESVSRNWGFSSLKNVVFILKNNNYFAFTKNYSLYFGLNNMLVVNNLAQSRITFETGVLLHF
jgi:hypothetical protein